MVNVAGRSQGCNTCRRGKKGCDLQKPACARCQRDNFQCEGYERTRVFISHQPLHPRGSSTKVPAFRAKTKDAHLDSNPRRTPVIQLRGDLMIVAYQQQTFAQFIDTYLPKGDLLPRGGQRVLASCSWMDTILQLATKNNTLRQALCAVSYSSQGSREGDECRIRQGAQSYGAAIVRLNQALQSEAALTDEAVIPTCQLLSYYEQFNGFASAKIHSQGRNWQAHSAGLARILQYRGPDRHTSTSALLIFRQTRIAQLAYFCGLRKACPFDTPEWLEQPWLGDKKPIRDRLLDITVALPRLLERSDQANLPGNENLKVSLMQDCITLHQKMQTWLADARQELRVEDSESGINPFFMDDTEYLMMHGMDVAASAMVYWAISVLLCGTMRVLSLGVPSEMQVDTHNDGAFNPEGHAVNIVRCMHHFLTAEAGLIGFQNSSFPLGVALMYFAAFHKTETTERETIRRHLWGPTAVKPYGPLMGAFLSQLQDESSKRWKVKSKVLAQTDVYSADRHKSQIWFQGKERELEQAAPGRASKVQI